MVVCTCGAALIKSHLDKVLGVVLGWFPSDPPPPLLLSPPLSDLPLSRTCGLWSLLSSESSFNLDSVSLSVSCTFWLCVEDGLGCPEPFPLSMFESSLAI